MIPGSKGEGMRCTGRGKRRSEVEELKDEDRNVWSTEEEIIECSERTWGALLNTECQAFLDIQKSGSPTVGGGQAVGDIKGGAQ